MSSLVLADYCIVALHLYSTVPFLNAHPLLMWDGPCFLFFFTVPQTPTSVPLVASIGTTFLFIMWNALDCEVQNGPVTNYIVEYTAGDTSLTASADTTLYNLTELEPCTNYSIRVATVNEAGIGGFSESVSVITKAAGQLHRKE